MHLSRTLAFVSILVVSDLLTSAGVVTRGWYDDLTTRNSFPFVPIPQEVAPITTRSRFPDMPLGFVVLTNALDDQEGLQLFLGGGSIPAPLPTTLHEAYRSLIRGYIEAPQTGNYFFWVLGDDAAEFRLSLDGSINPTTLCSCPTPSRNNFESSGIQKSEAIFLQKGAKYYFELEHWELGGRDRAAAGWQLPDGTLQRPIPSRYLLPLPMTENLVPEAGAADLLPRYTPRLNAPPRIIQPEYVSLRQGCVT